MSEGKQVSRVLRHISMNRKETWDFIVSERLERKGGGMSLALTNSPCRRTQTYKSVPLRLGVSIKRQPDAG